jgi:hypothetical protein
MNRIKHTALVAAAALTLAVTGGTVAQVVEAPPAEAYSWTNEWWNPQTRTWWAYKVCTREEWFAGCTNGWYQAWYPVWLWG